MLRSIFSAISFLTIIPVPKILPNDFRLGNIAPFFPLTGLIIGILLLGFDTIAAFLLPGPFATIIVLSFWVIVTGGIHLDGLIDCCDALFVPVERQRRLEILRDPHVGSFGVIGLLLHLSLKALGIYYSSHIMIYNIPINIGLLVAPIFARWWVLIGSRQPQARNNGLGLTFSAYMSFHEIAIAFFLPLIILIFLGWHAWLAFLGSGLITGVIIFWGRKQLGGMTGDVFGWIIESCEMIIVLIYSIRLI